MLIDQTTTDSLKTIDALQVERDTLQTEVKDSKKNLDDALFQVKKLKRIIKHKGNV